MHSGKYVLCGSDMLWISGASLLQQTDIEACWQHSCDRCCHGNGAAAAWIFRANKHAPLGYPPTTTSPLCCQGCQVGGQSSLNITTWLLKAKAEIMKKISQVSVAKPLLSRKDKLMMDCQFLDNFSSKIKLVLKAKSTITEQLSDLSLINSCFRKVGSILWN